MEATTPSDLNLRAVFEPDDLRVFDARPPTTTAQPRRRMEALEDVEDERVGAIADRVDDGLAGRCARTSTNQLLELRLDRG